MRLHFRAVYLFAGVIGMSASLAAQGPSPDERVAALKQSLQESQGRIRQYEWIETTVISLKGEEKARTQKRCYYGADGKLEKVPIGEPAAPAEAAGGRGRGGGRLKQRVVENKKDEMQDYMERATNLVHMYVPPDPAQIEAARDAGKLSIRPLEANAGVSLVFADYLQPGDRLAIDADTAGARLLALNVASYLGEPDEAVTLSVRFGALQDRTSYAAETSLEAKAKDIRVVISNSGHRKMVQ